MEYKKINIVTINLNNKSGLEKTIKSVVNQTFFDKINYIVIDGGSTDGGKELIQEYEKYIDYWCSEKDSGLYNAMNKGIDVCNGEYSLFLNSGDYFYSDDVIEKIYDQLDCDIVYGNQGVLNRGKLLLVKKYPKELSLDFFKKDALPHQATFIKTQLLIENHYREDYRIVSDWIFLLDMTINKKVSYKYIDVNVSYFSLGGISRDYKLVEREKNRYLNENKLDIFICTHKDFNKIVNNETYQVVDSRNINKKYNGLDDKFYSELLQYFYIADTFKLKDYVGFCHYRRYFSFMDNIPNMNTVFKVNDVIIAKPFEFKETIREQYESSHNIEDLNIVEEIIKKKYSDYHQTFIKYINQKMFIRNNMFIMRKEDFLKYIAFIRGILDEYLKIVGTDIQKRVEDNKDKYLKKFYPNNTVEYQYRIGGYLAERLTGVFICKHFKRARCYNIKITEKKY